MDLPPERLHGEERRKVHRGQSLGLHRKGVQCGHHGVRWLTSVPQRPLAATSFQGYFEAIESDLVDGVNPVLSMPTAFKAMADGGLECNPVDKLPKLPVGEDSLYGVMSYDNSLSSQLVQRVMPKAQCYTEFESSSLTIDGNQSCTDLAAKSYVEVDEESYYRRRLDEGGGSAGGTSVLAISALPSNGGAVVAASLASTVWLSVFASLLAGCFAC